MFPLITESEPITSQAAAKLAEFEQHRDIALPELYKEFVLTTNGGRPLENTFPIKGMALNPIGSVHFFFGIDNWDWYYDVVKTYDFFIQRNVPSRIVFIATTGSSDKIALDLRKGDARVAFWDHRAHWGTGEWRESDLYHIADSFEEFLKSLKRSPH